SDPRIVHGCKPADHRPQGVGTEPCHLVRHHAGPEPILPEIAIEVEPEPAGKRTDAHDVALQAAIGEGDGGGLKARPKKPAHTRRALRFLPDVARLRNVSVELP